MIKSGVFKQFLAAITCNIASACFGSSCAWGGPNFLVLISNDSPLRSGPLSRSEASLVVSIPCAGAIFGTLLFSTIVDRFGRKKLMILFSVAQLLSWTMILAATTVYHLYAARLVGGIVSAGILIVVPIYVSEIADDRIRGTLGSVLVLAANLGTLFGFVIANYLDFYGQIKANIMFPIVFLIAINSFPETPAFLLKCNLKDAADKSRRFYHSSTTVEMRRLSNEREKFVEKTEAESTGLSLSDFCSTAAKRATVIALVLGAMNQFCGVFAMINYTNKIFEDAGSTLPSSQSSVIVAAVQLFANFVAMALVDRAGRKLLMSTSALGTAIGLICMGLFDLYKEQLNDFKWIPIASFSTIIFMASIGMMPLTFVLLNEILPKKIQNVVVLMALEVMWISAFILTSFYPMLTAEIGTYNCMFIFASCCIVGAVFYLTVLPETKGKSHDEIMKSLENK